MPATTFAEPMCSRFDPELWFGKRTQRQAIDLCERCPVLVRCLADADNAERDEVYVFGVRGGMTAATRVRTRKLRA